MENPLSPLHAFARLDDTSSPLTVSYELPHVPGHGASAEGLTGVVEKLEAHLSRLKFILFLREVAALWPDNVDALGLRVSGSDVESAAWHVRCWKADRQGNLVDKIASPSFTRKLTSLPLLANQEVFRVACEMFSGEPRPLQKKDWALLEMECQPPEVRPRLLSEIMIDILPPSPPSTFSPRL